MVDRVAEQLHWDHRWQRKSMLQSCSGMPSCLAILPAVSGGCRWEILKDIAMSFIRNPLPKPPPSQARAGCGDREEEAA